jgi:malonyl CoA-acyl carrier protein transacylase
VVSGHVEALDEVQKLAAAAGALKVQRLAVSGAFHTNLMEPAKDALLQVCTRLQPTHMLQLLRKSQPLMHFLGCLVNYTSSTHSDAITILHVHADHSLACSRQSHRSNSEPPHHQHHPITPQKRN